MTREGAKLVGVDPEQLRQQLRRETDAKAPKQLTVALLYDAGFSPYEIEELLGVPAPTGYNWLEVVAERWLIAYTYYYNHLRSHQALDNQPPVEATGAKLTVLARSISRRLDTSITADDSPAIGALTRKIIDQFGELRRIGSA